MCQKDEAKKTQKKTKAMVQKPRRDGKTPRSQSVLLGFGWGTIRRHQSAWRMTTKPWRSCATFLFSSMSFLLYLFEPFFCLLVGSGFVLQFVTGLLESPPAATGHWLCGSHGKSHRNCRGKDPVIILHFPSPHMMQSIIFSIFVKMKYAHTISRKCHNLL